MIKKILCEGPILREIDTEALMGESSDFFIIFDDVASVKLRSRFYKRDFAIRTSTALFNYLLLFIIITTEAETGRKNVIGC